MASIRVLIVDDHPFFREGVKLFLGTSEGFEIIGAAGSGEEALEVLSAQEADVVLMDLQMAGLDGIETTRALLLERPTLRILILTSFGGAGKIQQALAAGAAGYCLKDAPPGELAAAIRAVAEGGTYLGRGITPGNLTLTPDDVEPDNPQEESPLAELTQRELDVLRLLTRGLGNKEIAEALFVSEKTVKTHVANVLQKLQVKSRTQAAILASKHGLFKE
jgi:NarL family two-component system response regulator LiaR